MHNNQLLLDLSRTDFRKIKAAGQRVPMALHQVIWSPGEKIEQVLFPLRGYVSLLMVAEESHAMEVGMVGVEGVLGLGVPLGVPVSAVRALVQEGGEAWSVQSDVLMDLMQESPSLQKVLSRYVYVVLAQLSQASACVRFHEIAPRLARWLLMCQDRSPGNQFPMTQEFLSSMLGVRRVSVTNAASDLQNRGLIRYHRGVLQVLDRPGLLAASCACYERDCAAYERVFTKRKPVLKLGT